MDPVWLIALLVVAAVCFGGGFYNGPTGTYPYRTGGWSLGGVLIVVLVVLLLMGRL